MTTLALRGLKKAYDGKQVLHGINLDIHDGEFVVLVGPSGCGKSTLIRMVAGLEDISEGQLSIDGQSMNDVDPSERGCAMVFQNYALYPHMTVRENIAYPLKIAGLSRAEVARRVAEAARVLDLEAYLDRRPAQLSGGQRQRVAMGRAIVRDPQVFLFDEPLSNLDAKLRVQMRTEIKELHQRLKTTTIYVTHDKIEAMTMADKIVVLNKGRIEQVGAPLELYNHPANVFVAGFIGSPSMNLLQGQVARDGSFAGDGVSFPMPAALACLANAARSGGSNDQLVVKDVATMFDNATYATFTRMVSLSLRHGVMRSTALWSATIDESMPTMPRSPSTKRSTTSAAHGRQ